MLAHNVAGRCGIDIYKCLESIKIIIKNTEYKWEKKHQVRYIQSDIPINTCAGLKNAPFYENYQEKEKGVNGEGGSDKTTIRYDAIR